MFILNFQFEQHILFHRASLLQTFHFFNVHSFKAKKVNHFEDYVNFWDMEHQLQENIFHHFLHYNFLSKFHQTQKYLQATFVLLPNHGNYLRANI